MNGRSRNGVACCLPSSRNEEVSACMPTEKRWGGEGRKSENVERYDAGRTEREEKRREKRGAGGDGGGGGREGCCRDGFSRELGEHVRGAKA